MTTLDPARTADAFRRAAVRATLAPSVYNTQPWRLRLGPSRLRLHPDRDRQLSVHDPAGRQLVISCGCALFNARASLAADGIPITVDRFPAGMGAGLTCAEIAIGSGPVVDDGTMALLDKAAESRRTNTRPFTADPVPDDVIEQASQAADLEGATLLPLSEVDALFAASQVQQALTVMQLDPAYRAELRAWRADPEPESATGEDPMARDPGAERWALLITEHDRPGDWLRAGEALERALLEITRSGYAVGLSSQLAEVPSVRTRVRRVLRTDGFPHVLLRIGAAPASPATRRRRLGELITPEV